MTRCLPTCGTLAATCLSLFLSSLLFSSSLLADDPPKAADPAAEQRLKDLEGKLDVLTKEIEGLRIGETAPGEKAAAAVPTLGLGPAASKVYEKKGVSIGGYGEIMYQNFAGTLQDGTPSNLTPSLDVARAVLYFGYKFD